MGVTTQYSVRVGAMYTCSESQHENKMAGAMQVLITVQTPIFSPGGESTVHV